MPRRRITWMYIVEQDIPFEGSIFYGIYSSRKRAMQAINLMYAQWGQKDKTILSIRKEQVNPHTEVYK